MDGYGDVSLSPPPLCPLLKANSVGPCWPGQPAALAASLALAHTHSPAQALTPSQRQELHGCCTASFPSGRHLTGAIFMRDNKNSLLVQGPFISLSHLICGTIRSGPDSYRLRFTDAQSELRINGFIQSDFYSTRGSRELPPPRGWGPEETEMQALSSSSQVSEQNRWLRGRVKHAG